MPPRHAGSCRYAIDKLREDPTQNSHFRHEFEPDQYVEGWPQIAGAHLIFWEFGDINVEYVYTTKYRVVIVLAFTAVPPRL